SDEAKGILVAASLAPVASDLLVPIRNAPEVVGDHPSKPLSEATPTPGRQDLSMDNLLPHFLGQPHLLHGQPVLRHEPLSHEECRVGFFSAMGTFRQAKQLSDAVQDLFRYHCVLLPCSDRGNRICAHY